MIFATRDRRRFTSGLAFTLCTVLVPCVWAEPQPPRPVPSASVEERLQKGVELRKQGRDVEALEEFREAYKDDKSFRVRAQVALAEQALGHWLEAERGLLFVLAADDDPWIAERRKALQEALESVRSHLGWLIVESNVPGAELRIDGVKASLLPSVDPLRIVTGTHLLEVSARGATPVRRSVEVQGNARTREAFELHLAIAPANEATESPRTALKPHESRSLSLSTGTLATASSVGLLLATGATALIIREINVAKYNDASLCVVGALSREERCGSYRDAANAFGYVAIGAFAGATVVGIGAGILLASDVMRKPNETVSLQCGLLGWGAICSGGF